MIKLFGKPIRVNKAASNERTTDVGANLFVGNLDPEVDEKILFDTFSAFGVIVQTPKIMRDLDTGNSTSNIVFACGCCRFGFTVQWLSVYMLMRAELMSRNATHARTLSLVRQRLCVRQLQQL